MTNKMILSIQYLWMILHTEMGSITFESNELHYHYIAFSSLPLPLPLHPF